MTDENIINEEQSDEQFDSAMTQLLANSDLEQLGMTIAGVLEFLTMRALHDGSYYIMTDDDRAITVIAADEDAHMLKSLLPESFKSWEDNMDRNEAVMPEVLTNVDPGDEQDGETE